MRHSFQHYLSVSVEDVSDMLLEGSVNCIGLHRRGLYCVGDVSSPKSKVCGAFFVNCL